MATHRHTGFVTAIAYRNIHQVLVELLQRLDAIEREHPGALEATNKAATGCMCAANNARAENKLAVGSEADPRLQDWAKRFEFLLRQLAQNWAWAPRKTRPRQEDTSGGRAAPCASAYSKAKCIEWHCVVKAVNTERQSRRQKICAAFGCEWHEIPELLRDDPGLLDRMIESSFLPQLYWPGVFDAVGDDFKAQLELKRELIEAEEDYQDLLDDLDMTPEDMKKAEAEGNLWRPPDPETALGHRRSLERFRRQVAEFGRLGEALRQAHPTHFIE